jgi:hypothetical protein
LDSALLKAVSYFPVRHHSPAASLALAELIKDRRPALILIEGPSDADDLIEVLADAETVPPVAILGYHLGEAPRSVLFPLASYSPEYVAVALGRSMKIPTHFIDLPIPAVLAIKDEVQLKARPIFDEVAQALGCRSFDEFWEAGFECRGYRAAEFITLMMEFGALARGREEDRGSDAETRLREAYMAAQIQKHLRDGMAPEAVLVVTGAFHAAGFRAGEAGEFKETAWDIPSARTVISFSYPRLSEQLGYGAGNRAPFYYQRAYDCGGDFTRATLLTLIEFTDHLREKGFEASLSHTIDAFNLARTLADIRGKGAPGLDEVRESTRACLLKGSAEATEAVLWDTVIGRTVGRVSKKMGRGPLQEEFYQELGRRRIPVTDEPTEFSLRLDNDLERGTSSFLHRLNVLEVPFGACVTTADSPAQQLRGIREKWEVRWSPATDVALVERVVKGNTIEQACERTFRESFRAVADVAAATDLLLKVIITDLSSFFEEGLASCEARSAADEAFYRLSRAAQNLLAVQSYGASRNLEGGRLRLLLDHVINRTLLALTPAANVDDDGIGEVCTGIKMIHEVVSIDRGEGREVYLRIIGALMTSDVAHPRACGLGLGLAHGSKSVDDDLMLNEISRRLSRGETPIRAAQFLEGFLSVNRLALVKNRPLVKWIDAFFAEIPPPAFIELLPVLRRAFADFSRSEITYLLENLSAILGIAGKEAVVKAIAEKELDALKQADQDLDDFDDLF